MIYESHQVSGACAVLFKRPSQTPPLFTVVGEAQSFLAQPARARLLREARKAGVAVDFGEDDESDNAS
jgi:hypothetical protein